jgi:hypothetical protein
MTNDELLRVLHLLIARVHLDLAGVRMLTDAEFDLIEDICEWWEAR